MNANYRKKGDKVYRFDNDGNYNGSLPSVHGKKAPKTGIGAQPVEDIEIFEQPKYEKDRMRLGKGKGAQGDMEFLKKPTSSENVESEQNEQFVDLEDTDIYYEETYPEEYDNAEEEEMARLAELEPQGDSSIGTFGPTASSLREGDILLGLGDEKIVGKPVVCHIKKLYNDMLMIEAQYSHNGISKRVTYIAAPDASVDIKPPF